MSAPAYNIAVTFAKQAMLSLRDASWEANFERIAVTHGARWIGQRLVRNGLVIACETRWSHGSDLHIACDDGFARRLAEIRGAR